MSRRSFAFRLVVSLFLGASLSVLICPSAAVARNDELKVGDKIDAEPGDHPATILEVSPSKTSFRIHYEDNAYPDGWLAVYMVEERDKQKKLDSLATQGPRVGKYLMYAYGAGSVGLYIGYFELRPGGQYKVFAPGGKDIGGGKYGFDKTKTRIQWAGGPFASKDWDGTQKFEVSREGKTHIVRLKRNTIGTNSTDSK